jgi:Fe2+ or Zn2+ uptake regulation protein
MNEIKDLLDSLNSDSLNDSVSLQTIYQALTLLVDRVETLEAEVAQLKA